MQIAARKLLEVPVRELWDILTGDFVLTFDDGELEVNAKETIYSSYFWEFHRLYPKTPLLKEHHVHTVLKGGLLNARSHRDLLTNCYWSTYRTYADEYQKNPQAFAFELAKYLYSITNWLYVDLTQTLEAFVTTGSILDFLDIYRNPTIAKLLKECKPTEESIFKTHDDILEVLKKDPALENNAIAFLVRAGLVKNNQVLQCIGPRGFMTDADSSQFKYPIMRGYANGIRLAHDSMIESRTAAKALAHTKKDISDSEYFSRRQQLMGQIVMNLHPGDCGTKQFLFWKVRGETDEKPCDLKFLKGKFYQTDEGLKVIKGDETHLIGKTISLRSVIHCGHKDPYGICTTCFGELGLTVAPRTNIGHAAVTTLAQLITQALLSVKHSGGDAAVDRIHIPDADRKYLITDAECCSFLLSDFLKNKENVAIIIPTQAAPNLTDIQTVPNIEDLSLARISDIKEIAIEYTEKGVTYEALIKTNMARRNANLTYPALNYIRSVGWDVLSNGCYRIPMNDWDWKKPLMTLPLKHYTMSDHQKDIATILEAKVDDMEKRDVGVSPDAFLIEFFDLVNDRIEIPLSVLETIVYGIMIRSAKKFDYRLPKPNTERGLSVKEMNLTYRSLSAKMAYEGHSDTFVNPMSFLATNRPNHIMDALLMPEEVLGNIS